jgi:hypothetical protein
MGSVNRGDRGGVFGFLIWCMVSVLWLMKSGKCMWMSWNGVGVGVGVVCNALHAFLVVCLFVCCYCCCVCLCVCGAGLFVVCLHCIALRCVWYVCVMFEYGMCWSLFVSGM